MDELEYRPVLGYSYEVRSDGVVNRNGKRSTPLKAYMDGWDNAPLNALQAAELVSAKPGNASGLRGEVMKKALEKARSNGRLSAEVVEKVGANLGGAN